MIVIKKIKNLVLKVKHFINYLYYFNSSIVKNSYPYKLIGEKINLLQVGTLVSYKILGQKEIKEILLQEIFNNKKLISGFHPLEAVKLGSIAFEDIIFKLPEDKRKEKFNEIKNIMLNSTHDIYPNKELKKIDLQYKYSDNLPDASDYLSSAVMKNMYPCKLVGGKKNITKNATVVTFTILGKREGYEKLLQELVEDKKLLEKFHPTEAIKFGFIYSGDIIFALLKERKQKIKQIKIEMLNA